MEITYFHDLPFTHLVAQVRYTIKTGFAINLDIILLNLKRIIYRLETLTVLFISRGYCPLGIATYTNISFVYGLGNI